MSEKVTVSEFAARLQWLIENEIPEHLCEHIDFKRAFKDSVFDWQEALAAALDFGDFYELAEHPERCPYVAGFLQSRALGESNS